MPRSLWKATGAAVILDFDLEGEVLHVPLTRVRDVSNGNADVPEAHHSHLQVLELPNADVTPGIDNASLTHR